jgi:small neutral amino acid transporter SnatA (MarC family)
MNLLDTFGTCNRTFFSSECGMSDDQFYKRNMLMYVSSVVFMIAGPLFLYFGFYLITWSYTVKWGSLSIALGILVLLFGFSLWHDRQMQTFQRNYQKSYDELRRMVQELKDKRQ